MFALIYLILKSPSCLETIVWGSPEISTEIKRLPRYGHSSALIGTKIFFTGGTNSISCDPLLLDLSKSTFIATLTLSIVR